MVGRDNLLAVHRALVDTIDSEADVGASGVTTADDVFPDHCAMKDGIGLP